MRPLLARLLARLRRRQLDRDLADEISAHLEFAAADHVERGLPLDEARRAATRRLGGALQTIEAYRDRQGFPLLESLWQDLQYAVRMLRRAPGFTAIAIASLSLGIGANTAIFSLIDTLMLRPLAVREPERLIELLSRFPGEPRINGFAWKYYELYRDGNHVFTDLVASSRARLLLSTEGVEREAVDGEYVSGNFFPALGIRPAVGRLVGPEDDRLGGAGAAVAVVSWAAWHTRFHLDPHIVGRHLVVEGVPAIVIGVTPPEFFGLQVGAHPEVWLPASMEPLIQRPSHRADGTLGVQLMGRLKPGVSLEQARAELTVLDRRRVDDIVRSRNASFLRQFTLEVEPAAAGFSALRDRFAAPLVVLMAIVGLLLLLASTNIASLLLARGAARQRELAVRVALGAGRRRLVRQMLTESLLLSAIGGAAGVVFAYLGADALTRIMLSGRGFVALPQHLEIRPTIDARLLLFAGIVAALTGLLFGLAPAWHAFATAPARSLREVGAAGDTKSRQLFGKSLVVAQVALSIVLLSTAGLFLRHVSHLRNTDLGFRRDSVLLVTLDPRGAGYDRFQLTRLYRELLGRLHAIPGVRTATLSGVTPIEGPGASRFANVEGFQERPEDRRYVSLNWVGPRYFETLGTPLLAGRDFAFEDDARPRVAIVNQAMARHYFRESSPLGKRISFDGDDLPYEIVGVVGDAKYLDLYETPPKTIYLNSFQDGRIFSQFALRTGVPPTWVAEEVRRAVRDVLKTVRVARVTTLRDQVDASIVPERLVTMLATFFGVLGALLAAVGLYGLLAYAVARRTSEIGVRMALGATERHVTVMVVKSALGLVSAGLVIGVPMAAWSGRIAASLVDRLTIGATVPLASAAAAMVVLALVAAYLPARRAARVQPLEALRHS